MLAGFAIIHVQPEEISHINQSALEKIDNGDYIYVIFTEASTLSKGILHYSDVTSPANGLFVLQLVQANNKWNIKAPHCWPFVRGTTSDRLIPLTNGQ